MKDYPIYPIFWIDLFCGFGGTTEGIYLSDTGAKVIACVNHDAEAIKCHKANHPDCLHFVEDIRNMEVVRKLDSLVKKIRRDHPNCVINIWASLECTHFSNAKGGMSRDADSRTLARDLYPYLESINPEGLYIENVREFTNWGPMYQVQVESIWKAVNNKKKSEIVMMDFPYEGNEIKYSHADVSPFMLPIKERKKEYYNDWVDTINTKYGYRFDSRFLNSADYGARTRRVRFFGIFAKEGIPISFPRATHSNKEDRLLDWLPVKDVLDLSNHGDSIFSLTKMGKKRSEKTLARIEQGLHLFHGKEVFLSNYNGKGRCHSIDSPLGSATTKERFAAHFVSYDYSSGSNNNSIEEPLRATTTVPKGKLISAWVYDMQYSNKGASIKRPCPTLIAKMNKKPLYLASTILDEEDRSKDLPGDNPTERSIKKFMRANNIKDIRTRTLTVKELLLAQGFPSDYVLTGTKTNNLKFIGNSVPPLMAKKLIEQNYYALAETRFKQTAISI